MTQLYSARSRRSRGAWATSPRSSSPPERRRAAADLPVTPLHAAEPVGRMEPSPYLPTTRRFVTRSHRSRTSARPGYLASTDA